MELSPAIYYNHSVEDTLLSASYVYDLHWYEDRDGTLDQTHMFNAMMDHEFSERYKLMLNESFVVSQDPGVLISGGDIPWRCACQAATFATPRRLILRCVLTKLFDLHFGYVNSVYAYQQNGGDEP